MEKTAERQRQRTAVAPQEAPVTQRANPLVLPGILSALGILLALSTVETEDDPAVEAPVMTRTHEAFLKDQAGWDKCLYTTYHPGLDLVVQVESRKVPSSRNSEFPTVLEFLTAQVEESGNWRNQTVIQIRCKITPNQVNAQFYNNNLQRWENHTDIGDGHPDHFRSWITEGNTTALERFARYAARRLRMGDKYVANPTMWSDQSSDGVSILQEPLTQLVLGGLQTLKPSVVSTTPS